MSRQGTVNRKPGSLDGSNLTGAVPLAKAPGATGKDLVAPVELKSPADAVRKRAYELYVERIAKGQPGDERSDWIRAERELRR